MNKQRSAAQLVAFQSHLISVLKNYELDEDFFGWVVGRGENVFKRQLIPLVKEFKRQRRWYAVDSRTIMVNLDAPLFGTIYSDVVLERKPIGSGMVKVERDYDDLRVNGQRVVLALTREQNSGQPNPFGPEGEAVAALEEKERELNIHPNIMEALVRAEEEKGMLLIPDWMRSERLKRFPFDLLCWGAVYKGKLAKEDARVLNRYTFERGQWLRRTAHITDNTLGRLSPAVRLESKGNAPGENIIILD